MTRAAELVRILLTQDQDYFQIALRWQLGSREFPGILFSHQKHLSYRQLIDELEIIALAGEAREFANHMEVLPLRSS